MSKRSRTYGPALLLSLFLSLAPFIHIWAQTETYVSYNEKYGLNRNYINSMVRDSSGFFWLATEKGVVRFDGANFTDLSPRSGKKFPGAVARLKLSGHHLLLIYESGKLQRLDIHDYTIEALPVAPAFDLVQLDRNTHIILQQDGWLVRYEEGKAVRSRRMSNDILKAQSQVYLWHGRLLVVMPDVGAYWLDPLDLHTLSTPLIDLSSVKLYFSEYGGDLYLFTAGKAVRIDRDFGTSVLQSPDMKDPLSTDYISFISPSHYYYIQRNKRIMEVIGDSIHQLPLPGLGNVELRTLYQQDSTHTLVGTNQGLLQVRNRSAPLSHLQEPDRIRQTDIRIRRKILPWTKDKWVMLGFPNAYFHEPVDSFRAIVSHVVSSYDGLVIGDDLFMTTEGSGLIHINLRHPKLEIIEQAPFKRQSGYVAIFHPSGSDTLLVGATDSLLSYNYMTTQAASVWGLAGVGMIKSLIRDTITRGYWIGTENGVYQLDARFKTVRRILQSPEGLSGSSISDLLFDRRSGLLWVSHENGVDVLDRKNGSVVNRLSTAVLSNTRVVTMVQDRQDRIWMATYGGITGYDPTNRAYIQLGRENGLINSEFNYKSAAMLPDGRLIFGGLDGYDIVQPSSFNFSRVKVEGMVTGYEKFSSTDTSLYPAPNIRNNSISFDVDRELLRIYLSARDIPNAALYRFEYNLDGENWIRVKGAPFINLYNLAPKEYVMQIRGFNEYGTLVTFPPLRIEAGESFFKSRGFLWAILAIAGLFIGLYITLLLTRSQRERNLKEKISMDLHDEVGTILTRSLYLTRVGDTRQDRTKVEQYLNEALYSLRAYIHTMNRSDFSVSQLRDELLELLQSTFRTAGYEVSSDISMDSEYRIPAELYRDIKLSMYEIMNNTIRHANGDRFIFGFRAMNGMLYISTCDNGILDDVRSIENKGNGVRNLVKRVKRHTGKISFSTPDQDTGLCVKMNLPLA
jgi:hypothetical protein